MITSNSKMKMKMSNDDDVLVNLGLVRIDMEPICDGCSTARPYGEIEFNTIALAQSEAYCTILKAEKDKGARRFEVAVVGDSIVHLGGYVTAVRINATVMPDHLVMNVTVQLTAGPSHEFTCA